MEVQKNKSLKELNQYGVDVKAKLYIELRQDKDIEELLEANYLKKEKFLILGQGNNILFRNDFDGLIIRPLFKGKKIIKENEKNIWIEIYSGEDWDTFVRWCVKNDYQGIENLVDIPSSLGGAVSQNIAAYGQNIMDVIESVSTIDLEKKEKKIFTNQMCKYSYRRSVFKSSEKSRYLLISSVFKLNKEGEDIEISYHERKARYGSLEDELKSFAKEPYTIQDVMEAVIRQRGKKLPSIKEYGTCGSVFENPTVTKEKYTELSKVISELQSYPADKLSYTKTKWDEIDEEYVKIPAGRIIDELGWRGKWIGDVGVHKNHALCLVTNRKASGEDIFNFLEDIRKDVKEKYDISLNYEINIIN